MTRAEHLSDPMAAALAGDAASGDHLSGCPSCAFRVRQAERLLGQVRAAGRTATAGFTLPDPTRLAARGRARRAMRRRVRTLAAACLVVALGLSGKLAQDRQRVLQDQADDALLRSIQELRHAPDVGGLGSLVDAGLGSGPWQG